MLKQYPTIPEFVEGRGYSREDWDAVDSPPLTDEELANMRPLKEALPWLYEAIIKAQAEEEAAKLAKNTNAVL